MAGPNSQHDNEECVWYNTLEWARNHWAGIFGRQDLIKSESAEKVSDDVIAFTINSDSAVIDVRLQYLKEIAEFELFLKIDGIRGNYKEIAAYAWEMDLGIGIVPYLSDYTIICDINDKLGPVEFSGSPDVTMISVDRKVVRLRYKPPLPWGFEFINDRTLFRLEETERLGHNRVSHQTYRNSTSTQTGMNKKTKFIGIEFGPPKKANTYMNVKLPDKPYTKIRGQMKSVTWCTEEMKSGESGDEISRMYLIASVDPGVRRSLLPDKLLKKLVTLAVKSYVKGITRAMEKNRMGPELSDLTKRLINKPHLYGPLESGTRAKMIKPTGRENKYDNRNNRSRVDDIVPLIEGNDSGGDDSDCDSDAFLYLTRVVDGYEGRVVLTSWLMGSFSAIALAGLVVGVFTFLFDIEASS